MKKSNLIILFCLLLLICGCNNDKKSKEKKADAIKWDVVEGEKITDNYYKEYQDDEYIDGYFITTYSKDVYKYLLPKNIKPNSIDFVGVSYSLDSMIVSIDNASFEDVDSYLKHIVEVYKLDYDEVYVESNVINKDKFITHATNFYFYDGQSMYKDELNIYIRDVDDEWNVIHYTLLDNKMNSNLIKKLVNGIKKEKDDSKVKNCSESGSNYTCVFKNVGRRDIEVLIKKDGNETFNYYGNSNYNQTLRGSNRIIRFGIIYYDDKNAIDTIGDRLIIFNRAEDINFNGKTFIKYYSIEDENYEEFKSYDKYYIYSIDDNTAFYLYMESPVNDDIFLDSLVDVKVN